MTGIGWENYEEYMMMHMDGELNAAEEKALMAFVNAHPELKQEMAAYERTRLTPDETQVCAHKEQLLKKEPGRRIGLITWGKYGIAAGVAAIIAAMVFNYTQENRKIGTIATNTPSINKFKTTNEAVNPMQPAAADTTAHQTLNNSKPAAAIASTSNPHKRANATRIKRSPIKEQPPRIIAEDKTRELIAINQLPIVPAAGLPYEKATEEAPQPVEVPVVAAETANDKQKKTIWDRLPLEDTKKEGLKYTAAAVAETLKDMNDLKKDILQKNFTVKVEKRKLIISF
jgi:hypothetical protein